MKIFFLCNTISSLIKHIYMIYFKAKIKSDLSDMEFIFKVNNFTYRHLYNHKVFLFVINCFINKVFF